MINKSEFVLASKHNKRHFSADVRWIVEGKPKPVVLLVHGFKGFKDSMHFNVLADRFAEEGFVFMKMNLSHNGTNPDNPIDFVDLEAFSDNNFSIELDDIGVAIDYIQSSGFLVGESDVNSNEIYLLGHSRGGGISIIKACDDERVRKLVTWAAVTDFEQFWGESVMTEWKEKGIYYVMNSRTHQNMPLKYQLVEDFNANGDKFKISQRVVGFNRPFLAIHGDDDETVPVFSLKTLTKANPKIDTVVISGANHTFGGKHPWTGTELPVQAEKLLQYTVNFFRT